MELSEGLSKCFNCLSALSFRAFKSDSYFNKRSLLSLPTISNLDQLGAGQMPFLSTTKIGAKVEK